MPELPFTLDQLRILKAIAAEGSFKKAADLLYVTQPCLLYTSPSPRDGLLSRMPSSA